MNFKKHYFLGACLLIFFFHLYISPLLGTHPDEAYYWYWSLQPKQGYLDHPPMIAWLIFLSQKIFSFFQLFLSEKTALHYSFRLLPYLISFIAVPLLIKKSIETEQEEALDVKQSIFLLSIPALVLAAHLITPDTVLSLAWAAALLIMVQVNKAREKLQLDASQATPLLLRHAFLMGVVLAFGAYSKYTAIFLIPLILLTGFGLFNSLIAASVALICVLPYLWWNFNEGKNSGIFFQHTHAMGSGSRDFSLHRLGDLLSAQIFLWSPLVFLFPLWHVFKLKRRELFYFTWSFLPVIVFSVLSLRKRVEGNWPVMGACAAIVFFALIIRKRKKLFYCSLFLQLSSIVLLPLLHFKKDFFTKLIQDISPRNSEKLKKPSRIDREFQNWDSVALKINSEMERTRLSKTLVIHRFQDISSLLFVNQYLKLPQLSQLKINPNGRINQFHFDELYSESPTKSYYFLYKGNKALNKKYSLVKEIDAVKELKLYFVK